MHPLYLLPICVLQIMFTEAGGGDIPMPFIRYNTIHNIIST
jgi:hypothetical protein